LAVTLHPGAYEAIVLRYRPELTRYCERMLPGRGAADDVVQETLLIAYRALERGERPEQLRSWLYGIARHRAASARRAHRETVPLSASLDGVERPEDAVERARIVREAFSRLARLPAQQRQALLARALEGRGYRQIADTLGVSDESARQLVSRARRALRQGPLVLLPAAVHRGLAVLAALGVLAAPHATAANTSSRASTDGRCSGSLARHASIAAARSPGRRWRSARIGTARIHTCGYFTVPSAENG